MEYGYNFKNIVLRKAFYRENVSLVCRRDLLSLLDTVVFYDFTLSGFVIHVL